MTGRTWRLPQAIRIGRSSPVRPASVSERTAQEERRKVSRLDVQGPVLIFPGPPPFRQFDFSYPVPGDHLYVDQIIGSTPVECRFDFADSTPILLEEGMTVQREYKKILLKFCELIAKDDFNAPAIPPTRIRLYSSFGPYVVQRPRKSFGLSPGFISRFNCSASAIPRILWKDALDEFSAFVANPQDTFALRGATLMLRNDDLTNTLYFRYTSPSTNGPAIGGTYDQNYWFPLNPGEIFEGLVENVLSIGDIQDLNTLSIYVATLSGTCVYSWLLSRTPIRDEPQSLRLP